MKSFFKTVGDGLVRLTGNRAAKAFLFQRISLAIQRGNATCMLGTLPHASGMDQVYLL